MDSGNSGSAKKRKKNSYQDALGILIDRVLAEEGLSVPALAERMEALGFSWLPSNLVQRLYRWKAGDGRPRRSDKESRLALRVGLRAHPSALAEIGSVRFGDDGEAFTSWISRNPPIEARCALWDEAFADEGGFGEAVRPVTFEPERADIGTGYIDTIRIAPPRPLAPLQFLDVLQRVHAIEWAQRVPRPGMAKIPISEALVAEAEKEGIVKQLLDLVVRQLRQPGLDSATLHRIITFGQRLVPRAVKFDQAAIGDAAKALTHSDINDQLIALFDAGRFFAPSLGSETDHRVQSGLFPAIGKKLDAASPVSDLAAFQLGAFTRSGDLQSVGGILDDTVKAAVETALLRRSDDPRYAGLLLRILGKQHFLSRRAPQDYIYRWALLADGGPALRKPLGWEWVDGGPAQLTGALGHLVQGWLDNPPDEEARIDAIRFCTRLGIWSECFLVPLMQSFTTPQSPHHLDEVAIALAYAPKHAAERLLLAQFEKGEAATSDREFLTLVGTGSRKTLGKMFRIAMVRGDKYAPSVAYALSNFHGHGWMTLLFGTGWYRSPVGRRAVSKAIKRFWWS